MNMRKGLGFAAMLVAGIVLASGVASGVTVFGASAKGLTDATPTCHADVVLTAVPVSLNINNNDTVRIWFNVTWYDNRSAGSSNAYHEFNVTAVHALTTYTNVRNETTTGALSPPGSANDFVDVLNAQEGNTIAITWKAKITVTGHSPCTDTETKQHTINLN